MSGAKPPYKIPSMAEIEAMPWNGLNVVSTFSGAGGSCLGYRMAGYRVLWASEFVPAAAEVYKLNHPTSHLDTRDIREVTPEDILGQTGLGVGELDLLDGSPPCASFSTSGKRERGGWGRVKAYSDTKQRVDDLFWEFARILEGLQPRAFVAENVKGLVTGKAKGYFKLILKRLREAGYIVKARVLDAQWLGVPQQRQRLIFAGLRKDLGLEPKHPSPLRYRYSVADVCPWICGIRLGGSPNNWTSSDRPSPTICQVDALKKMTAYLSGGGWIEHQEGEKNVRRKFTIAELRRICGFPDDFKLTGSYAKQWERLGRAVPPPMSAAVGRAVAEILKKG